MLVKFCLISGQRHYNIYEIHLEAIQTKLNNAKLTTTGESTSLICSLKIMHMLSLGESNYYYYYLFRNCIVASLFLC